MSLAWPTKPEPETPLDPESLEAEVWKLMAQHAAIDARGFDSARQRHDLHREIDRLLDLHADASEIDAL